MSLHSLCTLCAFCHTQGSTFGIPGVEEHAHFLRDVAHSTQIRSQLIANWNRANIPGAVALVGSGVLASVCRRPHVDRRILVSMPCPEWHP